MESRSSLFLLVTWLIRLDLIPCKSIVFERKYSIKSGNPVKTSTISNKIRRAFIPVFFQRVYTILKFHFPSSLVKRNALFRHFILLIISILYISGSSIHAHWKIPSGVRNWKQLESGDFLIHYPEGYESVALQASVYTDSASKYLGKVLQHRLEQRVSVFIYASSQDFASTNMFPGLIGESTGGFTDFQRSRVVVPFNGSYHDLRHVLIHEIVHAYQFDILHGKNPGRYPYWMMEGMAEYLSIGWDYTAEVYVRDAVLSGTMPGLLQLHAGMVSSPYMYYKGGQALMHYIAFHYGVERIGFFLKDLKNIDDYNKAFKSSFGIDPLEFDRRLSSWLRSVYSKQIKNLPDSIDKRLRSVSRPEDRMFFNSKPSISPDGKRIAYMGSDGVYPAIVIRSIPGPGVTEKKVQRINVLIRAMKNEDFEEYHPLTTRLSFSPDGRRILLSARTEGKQSLLIIDSIDGDIVSIITPPFDSMHYPVFSGDGERLLFTGVIRGKSDIYMYNLNDSSFHRVTNDYKYEAGAVFAGNDRYIFYSVESGNEKPRSSIYRIDLLDNNTEPFLLTDVPARVTNPVPGINQSIIVKSDHDGIPNLYRITVAFSRNKPVGSAELIPLTQSAHGIMDHNVVLANGKELTAISEINNGMNKIMILPPAGGEDELKSPKLPMAGTGVYNPGEYTYPVPGEPQSKTGEISDYDESLFVDGLPFVMLTAASNSEGTTGIGAIGFARLSDFKGDHQLFLYSSYLNDPRIVNFDIRYDYLKERTDYFAGAFHQTGNFAFFDFMALSLNQILYNPYYRLLEQKTEGVYAGASYPLGSFSSVGTTFVHGRNEQVFYRDSVGQRPANDVFDNYQSGSVHFEYDNAVYSRFGPLDGNRLLVSYSIPFRMNGTERELYTAILDYSFYHLFDNFSVFALHFFAGGNGGKDAYDYPFRIGGYNTIRGYEYQEFEGRYAAMASLEYRFTFIEYLQFAFPFRWNAGTVRGLFFVDAGAAFDDPHMFDAVGDDGRTRDMHMSIGTGMHWDNFLWFLFPGAIMKIEWASPYDLKTSLPFSQWQGRLSFGYNF